MIIYRRFLRSLLSMLVQHLRITNVPRFGTQLYITPLDSDTLMRIRLCLSWVEGNHVLGLGYFQILHIFKKHCELHYPNYYNQRLQGIEHIRSN